MLETIATRETASLAPATTTKSQLQATQSARMILDAYSIGVLSQSVISLSALPDLSGHQVLAKENAKKWPLISTQLIQINTNLIDYVHNFDNFYSVLYNLASDIDSGTNRADFIQGLQLLVSKIQLNQTDATSALNSLIEFQALVATDQSNITGDYNDGVVVYKGDDGEISQLLDRNKSLNSAMSKDNMMMGFGATGAVVGGLMIAVGVLGEFETGGLSTGLIVAGLAVVGAGAGTAIAGGVDYGSSLREYKENLETIQQNTAEMALLSGLSDQYDSYLDLSNQAISALKSMVAAWEVLSTQYVSLISQLQNGVNPADGILLKSELATAKNGWDDLLVTAGLIKDQCSEPLSVLQDTDPGYQGVA